MLTSSTARKAATEGITARIDAITEVPAERMKPNLAAPRSVKVELSGRCNYRCGFCALRTREAQPHTDMDFALFCRLAAEMRAAGVEELGLFFLGESFSNPRLLLAAVREAKRLGFPYVFLTTNGSLAAPALARDLMEAGLDSLKFSVNAADEAQFAEVMQVKSALYHQALENLKDARGVRDEVHARTGKRCGLYASSIRYDGEQQQKMEAMLAAHVLPWVDEHYWLPLYSMGAFATAREEELGYRPIAGNQGRLGALRAPLPCWSAFTEGHITSSGALSACCFDAGGDWQMADLKEVSFMEGWNSLSFVALREAHLKRDVAGTICEKCVAYS
jgi:pyruvate-formate lyase-activating enzyme